MRGEPGALVGLFVQFGLLSLFAIGGASTVVPEMQRQMVETARLADRPAVQRTLRHRPGRARAQRDVRRAAGTIYRGRSRRVVATAAMCGPTCFLAYGVSRAFDRFRAAPLTVAIQAGLVPVTIGLIASSALIIARASDHDWRAVIVTAAVLPFPPGRGSRR